MKAEGNSSEIRNLASGGLGRLLVSYSWPALVAMTLNALPDFATLSVAFGMVRDRNLQ